MTVAALVPSISYVENGSTLAFAVPFRFLRGTLVLERILPDATVAPMALDIDYTETGGETDAGGTVTLAASVAGATLKIVRMTPITQTMDYDTADTFPAESHEAALDKLTMIQQEQGSGQVAIDAELETKVNDTGDTMTGPLTAPGFLPLAPGNDLGAAGAPWDVVYGATFTGKAATAGHADTAGAAATAGHAASADNAAHAADADHADAAGTADRWTTPITINATGDVTGSVMFDGSENESMPLALAEERVKVSQTTSVGGLEFANLWPRLNPGGKIAPSLVDMPDAVIYKGVIDATINVPVTAAIGDLWLNSGSGTAAAGWGEPVAGDPLVPNDRLIYNAAGVWERITGSSDISSTIARDGTRPPIAPMPWGNQDLTGVKALTGATAAFTGTVQAGGITTNAAFVAGTSASIQSANDVSIMPPAAGGMGYNFNLYWHNASSGYKAHHAGWSAAINFDSAGGGLNISHSPGATAAGGAPAMSNIATFRQNGIWMNQWITGVGATFSNNVQAEGYYFNRNASAYLLAQAGSGNMVLNVDTNDYFYFDRATNAYSFNLGLGAHLIINPGETYSPTLFRAPVHYAYRDGCGGAKLESSFNSNTGYLGLYDANGTRRGYIGFLPAAAGNHISYSNENGGGHDFNFHVNAWGTFYAKGGSAGLTLDSRNNGGNPWILYSNDNWLRVHQGGERCWFSQTAFLPYSYHGYSLGDGNYPFWAAHAQNWVTVSDEREKEWRGGLEAAELAAAHDIIAEVGAYRMLRHIGSERDKLQIGVRAQKVKAILEAHGLDGSAYGFLQHHVWEARIDHDIDGKEVLIEAGDRYGIDNTQLALFLAMAQQQRMAAIEERLAAAGL